MAVGNSKRYVSLLHYKGTSGATMTYKIARGNIVYNINDARTHASYMLSSTIRKTIQHFCVIPYAMYPPPNIHVEATNAY